MESVRKWLTYLRDAFAYAPGSLNQCHSAVAKFFSVVLNKHLKDEVMVSWLKNLEKTHQVKQAPGFEVKDLARFLEFAPNSGEFLRLKVGVLVCLAGGPRGEESTYLLREDFSFDNKRNSVQFIVRKDLRGNKTCAPGVYEIPDVMYGNWSAIENFRLYFESVSMQEPTDRLWQTYRVSTSKWVKHPLGLTKVRKFPSLVAKWLGLHNWKSYTSHSFRRTFGMNLADAGASEEDMLRFARWKNKKSAEPYIKNSKRFLHKMSSLAFSHASSRSESSSSSSSSTLEEPARKKRKLDICANERGGGFVGVSGGLVIQNCQSVVINFGENVGKDD